jgi:hypothetical protein
LANLIKTSYTTLVTQRVGQQHISAQQDQFNGESGGVEFILNVDSASPIDVAVTITVEDNFPVEVQGL